MILKCNKCNYSINVDSNKNIKCPKCYSFSFSVEKIENNDNLQQVICTKKNTTIFLKLLKQNYLYPIPGLIIGIINLFLSPNLWKTYTSVRRGTFYKVVYAHDLIFSWIICLSIFYITFLPFLSDLIGFIWMPKQSTNEEKGCSIVFIRFLMLIFFYFSVFYSFKK